MQLTLQTLLLTLLSLFAVLSLAARGEQQAIIVSYPDTTPDSVLTEAKDAILKAGGEITHEYRLIQAFAAKVGAGVIDEINTMGAKYNARVEEDKQVHAQGGAF